MEVPRWIARAGIATRERGREDMRNATGQMPRAPPRDWQVILEGTPWRQRKGSLARPRGAVNGDAVPLCALPSAALQLSEGCYLYRVGP